MMVRVGHRQFLLCAVAWLAVSGCGAGPQKTSTEAATRPVAQAVSVAPEDAAPPAEKAGRFDGQKAYEHVARLVAIGPRSPGTEGIRRAQEYMEGQLRSFGCQVEEDNFHASTPIGSLAMKNIVVKIPGASPQVVLMGSHYDTLRREDIVFVGANDGGSSTGILLEMARLLCRRKNALTVWIAFFDGEEQFQKWSDTDSPYGSRQMAAKLALSGEIKRIKAMLLADLVGDKHLRIKRESNSTRWLTDLVWNAAARLGYQNVFVSEETAIQDDHLPFLKRKVPAADVIDLGMQYWHTEADTLDKISPRSLAIVGHVFLESLTDLEKKPAVMPLKPLS